MGKEDVEFTEKLLALISKTKNSKVGKITKGTCNIIKNTAYHKNESK